MDIAIIILGIIFLIMIIIFISLISYTIYKVSDLKNEQKTIINTMEYEKNKRFSDSIFMTNMKNIFFKFNHHLINNIFKQICKDTNSDMFYTRCKIEDGTPSPENDREYSDDFLKKYNKKINEVWDIIITTIKKIETPFYHKYTDAEIHNMIDYNFDLEQILYMQNQELKGNITYNIIMSNAIKANIIYMQIINDMIKHVTSDSELGMKIFTKFRYLIESIFVKFIKNNISDIKSIIEISNQEAGNLLDNKFDELGVKFGKIDIRDEIDNSLNRYANLPETKNKYDELMDLSKNTDQQLDEIAKHYKNISKNNFFIKELPRSQPDEHIEFITDKKENYNEPIYTFRIYELRKDYNFDTKKWEKVRKGNDKYYDVYIKEKYLDDRTLSIIEKKV
jgi:hypothetical protein